MLTSKNTRLDTPQSVTTNDRTRLRSSVAGLARQNGEIPGWQELTLQERVRQLHWRVVQQHDVFTLAISRLDLSDMEDIPTEIHTIGRGLAEVVGESAGDLAWWSLVTGSISNKKVRVYSVKGISRSSRVDSKNRRDTWGEVRILPRKFDMNRYIQRVLPAPPLSGSYTIVVAPEWLVDHCRTVYNRERARMLSLAHAQNH